LDILQSYNSLTCVGFLVAQRIHTSEATKRILDKIGGFQLKFNIDMKITVSYFLHIPIIWC